MRSAERAQLPFVHGNFNKNKNKKFQLSWGTFTHAAVPN